MQLNKRLQIGQKYSLATAISSTILLSSCASTQEPCCASFPIKQFKAVYQQKISEAKPQTDNSTLQTWLSNGKGQVAIIPGKESTAAHWILINYIDKQSVNVDAKNKTATTSELQTPWISNGTMDETNATSLGDKSIDGHPCKGWKVSNSNGDNEYWLGEDTGCYVLVDTILPNNKHAELKLVDYNATAPSPQQFTIPQDYVSKP